MSGTKNLDEYVSNEPFISGYRHMGLVEGNTMNQKWPLLSILSS